MGRVQTVICNMCHYVSLKSTTVKQSHLERLSSTLHNDLQPCQEKRGLARK